jgi:hypothetical protein
VTLGLEQNWMDLSAGDETFGGRRKWRNSNGNPVQELTRMSHMGV